MKVHVRTSVCVCKFVCIYLCTCCSLNEYTVQQQKHSMHGYTAMYEIRNDTNAVSLNLGCAHIYLASAELMTYTLNRNKYVLAVLMLDRKRSDATLSLGTNTTNTPV